MCNEVSQEDWMKFENRPKFEDKSFKPSKHWWLGHSKSYSGELGTIEPLARYDNILSRKIKFDLQMIMSMLKPMDWRVKMIEIFLPKREISLSLQWYLFDFKNCDSYNLCTPFKHDSRCALFSLLSFVTTNSTPQREAQRMSCLKGVQRLYQLRYGVTRKSRTMSVSVWHLVLLLPTVHG